ncbi:MAG: cytochrome c3 family protein [Chromatiales bacterium]|nr:cytochrome c3 family protein [Chromatiales bacterium]
MINQIRLLTALSLGLFVLGGSAVAGVVGSAHDLTTINANTNQVCVFCHTPHGSDSTVTAAPLWNKALPTDTYTEYSSSTMDGTASLTNSVSLACLSCHDGANAVDTVINAPTSVTKTYNYTAGGAVIGGVAGTNMATTNPVPAVAGDAASLQNDHPVSTPYGGGGAAFGANVAAGATTDPAFTAVVGSGGATGTSKVGVLPLYNKGDVAFVECASCHDPHDNTNVPFLRVSSASSAICTTCHVK